MVRRFGLIDIPVGEWKARTLDRVSCYPLGAHRAPVPRPGLAPGWGGFFAAGICFRARSLPQQGCYLPAGSYVPSQLTPVGVLRRLAG